MVNCSGIVYENGSFTLSVVIPNYNNGKFLEKCVKSVTNQNYGQLIEIIIVDDNSTDDSKDVIKALSKLDSRIKPIFLRENGQVSNARNTGLNEAVGEYVTFIDSDDFYFDNSKLENEMSLIKEFAKKGKEIISYSSIVFVSNHGTFIKSQTIDDKKRYQGFIFRKLVIDLYSEAIMRDYCVKKKTILEVGGYNASNNLFEDYELLLKLSKVVPFYYTGKPGTAYRSSINGLSKKPQELLVSKKKEIVREQLNDVPFLSRFLLLAEKTVVGLCKAVIKKLKRKERNC